MVVLEGERPVSCDIKRDAGMGGIRLYFYTCLKGDGGDDGE